MIFKKKKKRFSFLSQKKKKNSRKMLQSFTPKNPTKKLFSDIFQKTFFFSFNIESVRKSYLREKGKKRRRERERKKGESQNDVSRIRDRNFQDTVFFKESNKLDEITETETEIEETCR